MSTGGKSAGGDALRVDATFAEAAARDRGDLVARLDVFPWAFQWLCRCRFPRLLRIRERRGGAIAHGRADRGLSILPRSPRPIEAWS